MQEGCDGITVDDLKDQLQRHEGLLENLTISIGGTNNTAFFRNPPPPPNYLLDSVHIQYTMYIVQ